MSFDWLEYLALAQELVGEAQNPPSQAAKYRAAISRAYYAAFCKMRIFLRDVDGDTSVFQRGSAHSYVRDQFKMSPDRRRRKIGEWLDRLLIDRQKADYDDSDSTFPNLVISVRYDISIAQAIITELGGLPPKRRAKP